MAKISGKIKTSPLVTIVIDAVVLAFSLLVAYALRFNFAIPDHHVKLLGYVFPFTILLELMLLWVWGCNRAVWQWFSAADLPPLLSALASSTFVSLACRFFFSNAEVRFYAPISVSFMNLAIAICGLTGVRWFRRIAFDAALSVGDKIKRVVVVGTGAGSLSLAYALRHGVAGDRKIIGFLAIEGESAGRTIQGLPVYASLDNVAVDEVIATQGILDRDGMSHLLIKAHSAGATLAMAPNYVKSIDDTEDAAPAALRDADITDILKRGTITDEVFAEHRRFLKGRRVLVTGAGGSIGSEIARQSLAAGVEKLILLEQGELALFEISRELAASRHSGAVVRYIADIGDESRIAMILAKERPNIVFHAAAYKHVPLMEENVCEAIENNIFGTWTLANQCLKSEVGTFVLLSSDKAVEPSSVMGATKRFCELAIASLNVSVSGQAQKTSTRQSTCFTAVRFGNVLGSTGSVVPVFRDQIMRGGPVTITHPEMERYFMTIPEAASLTLAAASMSTEYPGCAFVLEMGAPVKITALAEEMIRLAGKVPGIDVKITYTGIRPGEKLSESLISSEEQLESTENTQIHRFLLAPPSLNELAEIISQLKGCVVSCDDDSAKKALFGFVLGKKGADPS